MENKATYCWEALFEDEEEDDALSFCNLTMHEPPEESENDIVPSLSASPHRDLFEFSNNIHHTHSSPDKIIQGDDGEELNEYQKRDYLTVVKSHSFRGSSSSSSSNSDHRGQNYPTSPTRTAAKSGGSHSSSYQVQKVNITSLTSMSAKSRRRMFMFGPVKFKPEMELSAIKERQGKRLTTMLWPDEVWDGDKVVVSGGKTTAKRRSHWAMVKATLSGRAHLNTVLTRSFVFGCIPAAANSGNWIRV